MSTPGDALERALTGLDSGYRRRSRARTASQARVGLPGWACGWLRTPLNVSSGRNPGLE